MAMDGATLEQLQGLNQSYYEQRAATAGPGGKGLRFEAMREAAIGAGARGGLIYQTKIINKVLDKSARNLDIIYDFQPLMIQGRVLPPILTETREVYTQGDAATLRLAGHSYKVEAQARFASRPPQWRDYLYISYGDDDSALPDRLLMPSNAEEQEAWKKLVMEGWKQGIEQANQTYQANLNRLDRDYRGMVRYHVLALKRMVTLPVVAQQNMPINREGNTMNLDETLLRITAMPDFNADMRDWSPLSNEDGQLQGGSNIRKGGR